MPEIKVTCDCKDFLTVDEIEDFQGDLKNTTKENIQKLKNSIIKHGFSFPAFIWKHDGHNFIIDAHQRKKALIELIDEGYTIEKIPVVYIEAANKKEAKEKLLQLNSQYSQVDEFGLQDFIKDFDINIGDFNLPIIDIDIASIENTEIGEDEEKLTRIPFGDERDDASIKNLLSLYDNVVCQFSGGKDSLAMVLSLKELCQKEKIKCVWCKVPELDWSDNEKYIQYCQEQIGIEIIVLQNKDSILDKFKKYGYPGRMLNWCNSFYKVSPSDRFLKTLSGTSIVCMGTRADESLRRGKMLPRGIWGKKHFIFPIFDWKVEDVLKKLKDGMIRLHHAYRVFDRFSCACCYQTSKNDWGILEKNYPKEYQRALWLFSQGLEKADFREADYCKVLFQNMTACFEKKIQSIASPIDYALFWDE